MWVLTPAKQILYHNHTLDQLVFVWSGIISVSYCSDGFLHSLLNVFPGGFTNFLHCPCICSVLVYLALSMELAT